MKLSITTDEGYIYELPISCLKYSKTTKRWVFYSKEVTKRKPFPIPNEVAESLLRSELTTRHEKGDYILFQVNGNPHFSHGIFFDPEIHLK